MRFHGWMIAAFLLWIVGAVGVASLAHAARHSNAFVSLQQTPACFVAANPQTGEVFGETNSISTYYDSSGNPIDRPWVHIQTASSNYQPGYSLSASASAPVDSVCTLLAGTPYEVRWHSLHVGYGDHVDGTGKHEDYDDADIWFANQWVHYTNAQRNVSVPNQGGFLTVFTNQNGEYNTVQVTVPGGDTFYGPGVRP